LDQSITVSLTKYFSDQQWSFFTVFAESDSHRFVSLRRDPNKSRIVDSCPLTKSDGDFSQQNNADDEAVAWLTSYGS